MAGQRIRGSETIISIFVDGDLRSRIDSVSDAEFTDNLEIQKDHFLGEQSPRFDQFYDGCSFRLSGQLTNPDFYDLRRSIVDKAKRRAGSPVRVDISSTLLFPDGSERTVLFPDCSFGSIPVSTSSRTDFTTWTLEGNCSESEDL